MKFEMQPEDFNRPVLLAHPAADSWTPTALSEVFFNRLGGRKKLVLLENCGHAPIEQPGMDQMREAVISFIESLHSTSTKDTNA